ncbi:hypothetical protein T484DRAFT_1793545 [Baffinella frigidus]|nr:hypothetical protein T484DRAFT_1793545 [Cryptophyta sp. CCMP2293]
MFPVVVIHKDLIASGRLTIVAEVHALGAVYREPCVVFAGHPSLRAALPAALGV